MIQQTIQQVKFEDIILAKKQRQARRTDKLRHWLQYLNMLEENRDFRKKNQVIKEMHITFILREDFWVRQVGRVLHEEKDLTEQGFEFAFLALEDGFYVKVAQLIAQKLVEAYNSQKLRINFVVAKLQILIAQFDHCTKQGSFFFDSLVKIYIETNNQKKIRQTYRRQISMGFDDYDVNYAKYLQWEKSQGNNQIIDHQELIKKARQYWQSVQIFNEEYLPSLEKSTSLMLIEQLKADKKKLKRCIAYLQNLNRPRIDEQKYLKLLNLFDSRTQKLWYLRRMASFETHQMVEQYFETLQITSAEDQQIINAFKSSFGWEKGQEYQSLYLSFLIRRINKHLIKPQDEDYNNLWGTNVEFFRNQLSELISRDRSNVVQQKQLITKYYHLWIQVETALVKDVTTVQQIFDSLLQWDQSEAIYIEYAQVMVRLGDIAKARQIFKKTCEAHNYEGNVVSEYQNFLKLYGTLEDIIKLKEKKTLRQSQKTQKEAQKHQVILPRVLRSPEHKPAENIQLKTSSTKQANQDLSKTSPLSQNPQNQPTSEQNTNINEPENTFKRPSPSSQKQKEEEKIENSHSKKKVHLDNQNTLFSQNVQKNWTEADIMLNLVFKQNVTDVRIVDKPKKRFCYIEFDSEENAQKEVQANKSSLNLALSHPPSKSDNLTLLLCNLPTDVSKAKINDMIPENYREYVKEIRTKQKDGKVTAYVEFMDQKNKDEALNLLKREKIKLDNRSIIALSCESDYRNKDKKYKTIFLKNLSFKCKQKDIKGFFETKGFNSVSQIFIPKEDKSNRSKGFAYVEFWESEDVQKAIKLQKGQLHGRQFSITKSDRAITHHEGGRQQKKSEKEENAKSQIQNSKSNNFFSNIFS